MSDVQTRYTQGYCVRDANTTGPLRFVAATSGVKGDGISLRMAGANLDRFSKSPVILWAHDYNSVPIGRATAWVDGDSLMADIEFDQNDSFARKIEKKYRDGFLSAVSVGFDFNRIDRDGTVNDWQLLEISAVPVPMDPDALLARQRTALRSLGEDLVSITDEWEHSERDITALAEMLRETIQSEFAKLTPPAVVPEPIKIPTDVEPEEGLNQEAAKAILAALEQE